MLQAEGDAEGGYSYHGAPKLGPGKQKGKGKSVQRMVEEGVAAGDVIFDGDKESGATGGAGTGEVAPYAHRDLKPG
jgi:serine/threonine kinase 16